MSNINDKVLHRVGRLLGLEKESTKAWDGPRLGRYELRESLGERTWTAVDSKSNSAVVIRLLGRADTAQAFAKRNQEITDLQHPVLLPWHKITTCGDLVVGARRVLSDRAKEGSLQAAYQLAQAVESMHEQGIAHGAIEIDKLFIERSGAPLLTGFRLVKDISLDGKMLQKLLEHWGILTDPSFTSAKEIANELSGRLKAE